MPSRTYGCSGSRTCRVCDESRLLLEVPAARLAAERARPADFERLDLIIAMMRQAVEAGDPMQAVELDHEFHCAVAAASQNRFLAELLAAQNSHVLRLWYRARERVGLAGMVEPHATIVDAVRRRDPERAEALAREHAHRFYRRQLDNYDLGVTTVDFPESARLARWSAVSALFTLATCGFSPLRVCCTNSWQGPILIPLRYGTLVRSPLLKTGTRLRQQTHRTVPRPMPSPRRGRLKAHWAVPLAGMRAYSATSARRSRPPSGATDMSTPRADDALAALLGRASWRAEVAWWHVMRPFRLAASWARWWYAPAWLASCDKCGGM